MVCLFDIGVHGDIK